MVLLCKEATAPYQASCNTRCHISPSSLRNGVLHRKMVQEACGCASFSEGWGIYFTTHLHLVPRLRMREAILLLPYTYSWRGTWLTYPTRLKIKISLEFRLASRSKLLHTDRKLVYATLYNVRQEVIYFLTRHISYLWRRSTTDTQNIITC